MMDEYGLLCIGLALIFLVAVLYGHTRREQFSIDNSSVWDSVRVEVEKELAAKKIDYDIAGFRKAVLAQNSFFTDSSSLDTYSQLLGIPVGVPDVSQVTNTNRLFDERIRLITIDMNAANAKSTINDLEFAHNNGLAIAVLKTLARTYMFQQVTIITK